MLLTSTFWVDGVKGAEERGGWRRREEEEERGLFDASWLTFFSSIWVREIASNPWKGLEVRVFHCGLEEAVTYIILFTETH